MNESPASAKSADLLALSDVWIREYSRLFPKESSRLHEPDFEWRLSARHFRDRVAFRRFLLGNEAPAWGKALTGALAGSESGAPSKEEIAAANACAERFCQWANARDLCGEEPFNEDPAAAEAPAGVPADPNQPAATESLLKKNLRILTRFWRTRFYALEEPEEARRSALREFAHEVKPAALCLSGGGIRSATFALGLLQRMACEDRLLRSFHYLSTVSGGGYIGAWLSSWIFRQAQKEADRRTNAKALQAPGSTAQVTNPGSLPYAVAGKGKQPDAAIKVADNKIPVEIVTKDMEAGLSQVTDLLGHVHSASSSADHHSSFGPEPTPVRHLRIFSNYLTPRVGLFSADTWTVAATFVRNMLLNWLVIVPLLMLGLLIPRFAAACISLGDTLSVSKLSAWGEILASVAMLLLVYALAYITCHRPSLVEPHWRPVQSVEERQKWERKTGQAAFLWNCILPTFIGVCLLCTVCVWRHGVTHLGDEPPDWFADFKAFLPFGGGMLRPRFLLCGILIAIAAKFAALPAFIAVAKIRRKTGQSSSWLELALEYLKELGALIIIFAATAWIIPSIYETLDSLFPARSMPGLHFNSLLTCIGPGVGFMVIFLSMNLLVCLVSRTTSDQDREWFSRAAAWSLLCAAAWVFISFLVLWGPWIVEGALKAVTPVAALSAIVTAFGSFYSLAPVTADAPSRGQTTRRSRVLDLALRLAAPVFVLSGIILLSCLINVFLITINGDSLQPDQHFTVVEGGYFFPLYVLTIALTMVSFLASSLININMFSLHAMYRSRLIRSYLGASREIRQPNIFTGFDPKDNISISQLDQGTRLFHVVNATLNLVSSKNLAWQERKAASFTMTPLTCGSINLGYRDSKQYAIGTDKEPLTLGGAITISGAAANPNMGYHSSPALTFLMTLLNARLGVWLGNTGRAGEKTFTKDSPALSAKPLISEAFGLTDEEHPYINLSDGGHFENLGLYEMVLRRCHFIVVSDAGCDPAYTFEDLGNAVNKIRVDLGIPIVFKKDILISRYDPKTKPRSSRYCAIGKIEYSKVDGPTAQEGTLIYFKPAICGFEPADVFHYARENEAFPHEPTSDQWFGESQFESYRMLGYHSLDFVYRTPISPKPDEPAIEELKRRAESHLA